MSGLCKYMVSGYLPRADNWVVEFYECRSMEAARKRFMLEYPTTKMVKVYLTRTTAELME